MSKPSHPHAPNVTHRALATMRPFLREKQAERRLKIWQLVLASGISTDGLHIRQIAKALGVSKSVVHQDILAVLAEKRAAYLEAAEHYADLVVARAEAVIQAHWQAMLQRDRDATEMVLKANDQCAKVRGAYAPVKVTGEDGQPVSFTLSIARPVEDAPAPALPEAQPYVIDVPSNSHGNGHGNGNGHRD